MRTPVECVNDVRWVAGFFDGEGCIYYKPHEVRCTIKGKAYSYPAVQVIIAQSGDLGKELMEAFQIRYGFGKITSSHGSKLTKKIPYMTRLSGKKALVFLKEIEPFLLMKQEKAKYVIEESWEHYFGRR